MPMAPSTPAVNILIINVHSMENAGDAALTLATLQQLARSFPGSRVSLAMNLPESFEKIRRSSPTCQFFDSPNSPIELQVCGSLLQAALQPDPNGRMYWRFPALIWSLLTSLMLAVTNRASHSAALRLLERLPFMPPLMKNYFQAYLSADLVISVPGNFLYSSGAFGLTLLIHLYSLAYAGLLRLPLYIFPQSIGPFKRWWETRLVKRVLTQARIVMLREPVSLHRLTESGFGHPRLLQIPDTAFSFKPDLPGALAAEPGAEWLASTGIPLTTGKPLLGVTLINWQAQNPAFSALQQANYEAAVQAVCREFVQQTGGVVIFFTQVTGSVYADRDNIPAARSFSALENLPGQVFQLPQPSAPETLLSAYASMDIFIGSRMHSNIFALLGGVPVLAVAYRHKTIGLMQEMGLANWALEIETLSLPDGAKRLSSLFWELWQNRQQIRQKITARTVELSEQSARAAEWVLNDYTSLQKADQAPPSRG